MLFHYDYSKKKYIMHFAPLENIYNYIYSSAIYFMIGKFFQNH